MQSPGLAMGMGPGGTWDPAMGIKFGGGAPPGNPQPQGGNQTWDPQRGFKFG